MGDKERGTGIIKEIEECLKYWLSGQTGYLVSVSYKHKKIRLQKSKNWISEEQHISHQKYKTLHVTFNNLYLYDLDSIYGELISKMLHIITNKLYFNCGYV